MASSYTDEILDEAEQAYATALSAGYRDGASPSATSVAAETLGLKRTTFLRRLGAAQDRDNDNLTPRPLLGKIPESDVPVEEIIDSMERRFKRPVDNNKARSWRSLKVPIDGPFGIVFYGDMHVDDDGCNWPLLKEHLEINKNTYALYGAHLGDATNNWVGRLEKKYADQETSRATGYRLAEWIIKDSGVTWLAWLLGNHDNWNEGGPLFELINRQARIYMEDWRAQFKLVTPSGREVRIDAAHNFKGHSQWNKLHGGNKTALMGAQADLYISGHTHTWGIIEDEHADRGNVYHVAKARGYKYMDEYAFHLNFGEQQHGAAITMIVDPAAKGPAFVKLFADVREAAEFLTWKRKKAGY